MQRDAVEPTGPEVRRRPFTTQRRCSGVERRAMERMGQQWANLENRHPPFGAPSSRDTEMHPNVAAPRDSWAGTGTHLSAGDWGTRIEQVAPYTSVGTGSEGMEMSRSFFNTLPTTHLPRLQEDSREVHSSVPGSHSHASQNRLFPRAPQTWEATEPVCADGRPGVSSNGSAPSERQPSRAHPRRRGADEVEVEVEDTFLISGVEVNDVGVQFPTPPRPDGREDDAGQSSSSSGAVHTESGSGSSAPASTRSEAIGTNPSPRTVNDLTYPTGLVCDMLPLVEQGLRSMAERAINGSQREAQEVRAGLLVCAFTESFKELEAAWQLDYSGEPRIEERTAKFLSKIARKALRTCQHRLNFPQEASSSRISLSLQDPGIRERRSELQACCTALEADLAAARQRNADFPDVEHTLLSRAREPELPLFFTEFLRQTREEVPLQGQEAGDAMPEYASRSDAILQRLRLQQRMVGSLFDTIEEEKRVLQSRAEALSLPFQPEGQHIDGLNVLGGLF